MRQMIKKQIHAVFFIVFMVSLVQWTTAPVSAAEHVVTKLTVPQVIHFYGVAVNPNTDRLYVVDYGSGNNQDVGHVVVIDTISRAILAYIPVGLLPVGIAVNPITNRIYVGHNRPYVVTVIDGATNTMTDIPLPNGYPEKVFVDTTTNRIYVSISPYMAVIDGADNSIITTLPVTGDVGINSATGRLYVASRYTYTIHVFDSSTYTQLATIDTSAYGQPGTIVANPLNNRLYIGITKDTGEHELAVLDGVTNTFINIPRNRLFSPQQMVVNVNNNRLYTANETGPLTVTNGANNSPRPKVPIGPDLRGIAIDLTTNLLYVTDRTDMVTIVSTT